MPRQNRVTPFGDIIATPERGTFMGNRGLLHDEMGNIRRAWRLKQWLICLLEFRGRKRMVMTPGRYTELFFLDEATALAAGHRPCAECRRASYLAFANAWKVANRMQDRPLAPEMDARLHQDRMMPDKSKNTYTARLEQLPDGAFVTLKDNNEQPYLVWGSHLLAWSPGGYRHRKRRHNAETVVILTPKSAVRVIQAGYVPNVHDSAKRLSF
jgi:hypothetical protein